LWIFGTIPKLHSFFLWLKILPTEFNIFVLYHIFYFKILNYELFIDVINRGHNLF
jgi:hypothetical protein